MRRQAEDDTARSADQHGGRVEVRTIWTTTRLNDYLDWPEVGQVCRLERVVKRGGETTREVAYAITSAGPGRAGAADLLGWWRGHWGIENRLHWVRDVTLGEDACRVRKGSAPQVLAALRNATVHLLAGVAAESRVAATEILAARPNQALSLLGRPPLE